MTLKGHNHAVSSISISQDNKYIVSGSLDSTIKYWTIKGGKIIKTLYDLN